MFVVDLLQMIRIDGLINNNTLHIVSGLLYIQPVMYVLRLKKNTRPHMFGKHFTFAVNG